MGDDEPRYPHDHCGLCVWLGRCGKHDLYFCPQHGLPTVIARFGAGPRYRSGMSMADIDPQLFEARLRAVKRGLY
jgi:hypothetical protein